MTLELAIAGVACLVLAFGHTAIGRRAILPALREARLPSTSFGSSAMTFGMVRFTWHIVGLLLLGFGVLLMALAWVPDADTRSLLLRWLTALWLAATALACWNARHRPRTLLRPPVAVMFAAIAALCWTASG